MKAATTVSCPSVLRFLLCLVLPGWSLVAAQEIRVPDQMWECEGQDQVACGTWTFKGTAGTGEWRNGAVAELEVQQFDPAWIIIRRSDPSGFSKGLTAIYVGKLHGNRIEGTVKWTWLGHWNQQVEGTWYATFEAPDPPASAPGINQGAAPEALQPTEPAPSGAAANHPPTEPAKVPSKTAGDQPALPTVVKSPASEATAFAKWMIGWQYAADNNFVEARAAFKQAADLGSADAAFEMGQLYNSGWGVEKDKPAAARWYEIAADGGNTIGLYKLSVYYLSRDRNKALELARTATAAGESDAAVGLAEIDSGHSSMWKAEADRLRNAAFPICNDAREATRMLIQEMYASPGFVAANALPRLILDVQGEPQESPPVTMPRMAVTKVHGAAEIECDAIFDGVLVWPLKINRIGVGLSVPETALSMTFIKDGSTYLVTRATFIQYLAVMTMRQGLAMQGVTFVPGLHDIGIF